MNKRKIEWTTVRGPKAIATLLSATAFGAGLLPFAPGTMGTLVGIPLAYFSAPLNWPLRLALWGAILILGVWAAKSFDQLMKTEDNQNIVIDEVLGLGIAAWTAGQNLWTLLAAFIFFRFFDILKPPPVRQVDRWSKIKASEASNPWAPWHGGFGVMFDDVLAGFQGLAVILVLQYLQWLP